MEILTILLIFSLGVIMLGACFIAGIAFVIGVTKRILASLFNNHKK